jgi:uncharacterized membrane protein YedE/YeeE
MAGIAGGRKLGGMTEFTPIASTVGGVLIGLASALLLMSNGRIAGVSGIVGPLLGPAGAARGWRIAFLVGLLGGGVIAPLLSAEPFGAGPTGSLLLLVVAGLLVGIGTQLGGGCTSGHGVCGLSRASPRSLVATLSFMAVAAITVFVTRHVVGVG